MRNKIVAIAKAEVGKYKEGPNNDNPYGKAFDTKYWQFFNGKKNFVPYCAIWICYLFVVYFKGDLKKAAKFIGAPTNPDNNCAAGVKYLHQYLKSTGSTVPLKDGRAGDIIFFRHDAHVGIIEKIANGYYHTIEGNKGGKSSDCVARGKYKIGSSNITGIVRPNYPIEPTNPNEPTKPTYQYPTLPNRGYFRYGDKGEQVKVMQRILLEVLGNPHAMDPYGADGDFGPLTSECVFQVQAKVGVAKDRLYGPKTNAACKRYLEGI